MEIAPGLVALEDFYAAGGGGACREKAPRPFPLPAPLAVFLLGGAGPSLRSPRSGGLWAARLFIIFFCWP